MRWKKRNEERRKNKGKREEKCGEGRNEERGGVTKGSRK